MTMDVAEELKKAQAEYVTALKAQLESELEKKVLFEQIKSEVAGRLVDGKAPSEAACERQARCDRRYVSACQVEIKLTVECTKTRLAMELVQYKMQAYIAMGK